MFLGMIAGNAVSMEYRAILDESSWQHSSNKNSCGLQHSLPLYGSMTFTRNARGVLTLLLEPHHPLKTLQGVPKVFWQAPEWKPQLTENTLTQARTLVSATGTMTIVGEAATKALEGLMAGNYASVIYTDTAGEPTTVSLSPVYFSAAYSEYRRCIEELPPPVLTPKEAGFNPVFFRVNGVSLDSGSRAMLDRLADYLLRNPQISKLIVSGHSDSTGGKKHNDRISRLRAKAVAVYLSNLGYPKDRLMVEGLGESMPISTNKTVSGRAMNRRVELVFVYGEMPGREAAAEPPPSADVAEEEPTDESGSEASN